MADEMHADEMVGEKKKAFARMRRCVKEAKRGLNSDHVRVGALDYMVKLAEEADAETRKHRRTGDIYHAMFTTRLAKLVGDLATEWTT